MTISLTPDGRYIVIEGKSGPRLWRASNPALSPEIKQSLVERLMNARRALRKAGGHPEAIAKARSEVDTAKRALGERGAVWWTDGQPDLNRRLIKNTPYRSWWEESRKS